MHLELKRGQFTLSTDPARLDLDAIHDFLSRSYWGKQRPRAVLEKAIRHSLCFGVYDGKAQIGFARAITDYATFGYIADVYILEAYRGTGLARWLIQAMLEHPELKGLRRWQLVTQDAHALYRTCGFSQLEQPDHHMQRLQPYPGEKGKPGPLSGIKNLMGKFSKTKLLLSVLLSLGVSLVGCAPTREEAESTKSKEKPEIPSEGLVVSLSVTSQKSAGIETLPIVETELPLQIKAQGRVMDIAPLVSFVGELAAAKATASASRAELARLQMLAGQTNASQRAVETATAAAERDQALLRSAQLRMFSVWGAALGSRADLPELLEALATQKAALLQINLPTEPLPREEPLGARVFPSGNPEEMFVATYLGPAAGPDTEIQGVNSLFLVRTNGAHLLPRTALLAYVDFPGQPRKGWLIPRTALVRFEGRAWVYVQKTQEQFERVGISLESPLAEGWFTTAALKPGDKIVTAGAGALLSQEFKAQISEE